MVDTVTFPAATGTFVAASDDIGGVQYQRVKITHGVDGVAVDASIDHLPAFQFSISACNRSGISNQHLDTDTVSNRHLDTDYIKETTWQDIALHQSIAHLP